jgi:hypothetical protein
MIVASHDKLAHPTRLQATRALISADDGTPVCLVVEYEGGPRPWFRVYRIGDKDFNERLREHGVTRTVLVTNLKVDELQKDGPPRLLG